MPANLPPQYFEAEKRYRGARTPQEKIEALEDMFALMPKHKGTDRLRAELRTKIARLSEEAERRPFVAKRGSQLYCVRKEGAGQAALVGLPNAGKSQLVSTLTQAAPQVGDYPFTTQLPMPGMMEYENVQVQLVDLPAITAPEVSSWLPNIVKNADLLLIVLDLTQDAAAQLEAVIQWLAKHRMAVSNELEEPPAGMTHVKRALVIANKADSPDARTQPGAAELTLRRGLAGAGGLSGPGRRSGAAAGDRVPGAGCGPGLHQAAGRQGESVGAVRGPPGQHRGGPGADGPQGHCPQPEIRPGLGLRKVRWPTGQAGLHPP